MRIAIDARLNAYRQGGIPQYTRQLLTALAEVAHDDVDDGDEHHADQSGSCQCQKYACQSIKNSLDD